MNSSPKLEDLPLHDAVLYSITLLWEEARAELSLAAFIDLEKDALPHKLIFFDIEHLDCPHLAPWGDSVFIRSANEASGMYSIEMQSGDVLTFKCRGFEFVETAL